MFVYMQRFKSLHFYSVYYVISVLTSL